MSLLFVTSSLSENVSVRKKTVFIILIRQLSSERLDTNKPFSLYHYRVGGPSKIKIPIISVTSVMRGMLDMIGP